jgi:hypothetical protein
MKKHASVFLLLIFAVAFVAAGIPLRAMESDESAIFLKNGKKIIGEIVDISSTRLVLQLKNGEEISLSKIWMINFNNEKWNYPDERKKIEGADHYLFLKDGGITSGRIVDFSDRQHVFELDNGEKIPIGRISRIYFAKHLPDELAKKLQEAKQEAQKENVFFGTFRSVGPRTAGQPEIELTLNQDMTARMNMSSRPLMPAALLIGRWEITASNLIVVRAEPQGATGGTGQATVFTFRREGNDLILENYERRAFGEIRLRKI